MDTLSSLDTGGGERIGQRRMPFRLTTRLWIEDASKGLFVALAAVFVLRAADHADIRFLCLCWAIALAANCLIAAWRGRAKLAGGRRRWLALGVLALLDQPGVLQACLLVGLVAAIPAGAGNRIWLLAAIPVGLSLGLGLQLLKRIPASRNKSLLLALAAGLSLALPWGALWLGWSGPAGAADVTAIALLLATAAFFLFILTGKGAETEFEVAFVFAGLSLALVNLDLPLMLRGTAVLLPLALYIVYSERIRRRIVAFKHLMRGLGHEQEGQLRDALWSYQEALAIQPGDPMATAGAWRVHRRVDLASLRPDDELFTLIDPLVCLVRVRELLSHPSLAADGIADIGKLLDIVAARRPDLIRTVGLERLNARLRAPGDTGSPEPISLVRALIDVDPPAVADLPPHEAEALYQIWALALKHPLLVGAGSLELLNEPERLFGFLAAVGRHLAAAPGDREAAAFRALVTDKLDYSLYARFAAQHPADPMDWFDHSFCWEVARIAASEGRTERAIDLLRIAEVGLPQHRLLLWHSLARLLADSGSPAAGEWFERVKGLALERGLARLSDSESDVFFDAVQRLAQAAIAANDLAAAIANLELYSRSPKSGLDTLATLRALYERTGDPLGAIKPVESALAHGLDERGRREWQEQKSRLYRAVSPAPLQSRLAQVEGYFDFGYCYRRAVRAFETKAPDEEVTHFLDLAALGGKTQLLAVNALLGRTHLRSGRFADAALCFEAVKMQRSERFADKDQEEAFFLSCRLLGDLYLEQLADPRAAALCFEIYKEYGKSGADTLYKLALAYERSGQLAHAKKWYDMVLVYPDHPRAAPARAALARIAGATKPA